MNLCESLSVTARQFPDQTALIYRGTQYSYKELDELSQSAARVLLQNGVQAGDRIALKLPNCPGFVVWYYAALRIGALAVSIGTRLSPSETQFILEDSGAIGLVCGDGSVESQVEGGSQDSDLDNSCVTYSVSEDGREYNSTLLAKVNPDSDFDGSLWFQAEPNDPALILYTSGTTGFPKGATLSHLNVRSNVAAFNHLCHMKRGDRVLLAVPLFHCFGQNALLNSVFNVGGTLVLQERFDLNESKRLIKSHAVNQLYGVPLMFQLLLESCNTDDLSSVEYCFSAAAPLPVQISEKWIEKFGQPIFEGYGLTETSPFASYNHRNGYVLGSIGTPIDAVEMKIVDLESGEDCVAGELGEIVIKGPNVMLGYWNREEDTANAIRNGWFHSGDIGRYDERQFFYIVDRVKDMISIGGLKVFPAEVERVIRGNPHVQDVAVVGVEESVLGEQVVAFLTPVADAPTTFQPDESADFFNDFLRDHLADYKIPRRYIWIDEIPRNPSGKVLKTKLREKLTSNASMHSYKPTDNSDSTVSNAGEASTDSIPPDFPTDQPSLAEQLAQVHRGSQLKFTTEFLTRLVQKVSGEEKAIDAEMTFMDIGLDSLMLVELGAELQVALRSETPLPASLLFDYPTVGELAAHLLECATENPVGPNNQGSLGDTKTEGKIHKAKKENSGGPVHSHSESSTTNPNLASEIEQLSEEEALDQLMKELE